MEQKNQIRSKDYLSFIGVPEIVPRTSPFDPGYDPITLESHLEQSFHLMSSFKISMACWQVANEAATRRKIHLIRHYNIVVCAGGGPFEVAVALGVLPQYLDLCADFGITRIEAGEGFTDNKMKPREIVALALKRGLEVQFEIGKKHDGTFNEEMVRLYIDQGKEWLDAGAKQIVVEGRESAQGIGVFGEKGEFKSHIADEFVKSFGNDSTIFEAPDKRSQFALLNHFGPQVNLGNVRLEELLRVEIYRRGLHSDAFRHQHLKPRGPKVNPSS